MKYEIVCPWWLSGWITFIVKVFGEIKIYIDTFRIRRKKTYKSIDRRAISKKY